jgi:hypothetical protein
MDKNPLTTTIIIFSIGDAYTLWEAINKGTVDLFTAIAWLQGILLFILYLKKSKFAGIYLFYSTLPFFPLYFGLKALGLNPPPAGWPVYVVAFVFYMGSIAFIWKQRRDYDQYLLALTLPKRKQRDSWITEPPR